MSNDNARARAHDVPLSLAAAGADAAAGFAPDGATARAPALSALIAVALAVRFVKSSKTCLPSMSVTAASAFMAYQYASTLLSMRALRA